MMILKKGLCLKINKIIVFNIITFMVFFEMIVGSDGFGNNFPDKKYNKKHGIKDIVLNDNSRVLSLTLL